MAGSIKQGPRQTFRYYGGKGLDGNYVELRTTFAHELCIKFAQRFDAIFFVSYLEKVDSNFVGSRHFAGGATDH